MTLTVKPPWEIGGDGWALGATRTLSPNQDERPNPEDVRLIVVHAISLPPMEFGGEYIPQFFLNQLDPQAHPYFPQIVAHRVSAHFLVRRTGELMQFVTCLNRAWHAGISCWHGREKCNDISVGIELEGDDLTAYTCEQYAVLTGLIEQLCVRFPIEDVVGHADIAPGRKTDPGPHFDWQRIE